MAFYYRGGVWGDTCVVLVAEGLILAGWFSLYIDTSSDVGLYTFSVTIIFAMDTGPPSWPGGGLQTPKPPPPDPMSNDYSSDMLDNFVSKHVHAANIY